MTDNPLHARTGDDGRFEIRGVPPGTWTLRVWHERLGQQEIPIQVGPGRSEVGSISIER